MGRKHLGICGQESSEHLPFNGMLFPVEVTGRAGRRTWSSPVSVDLADSKAGDDCVCVWKGSNNF